MSRQADGTVSLSCLAGDGGAPPATIVLDVVARPDGFTNPSLVDCGGYAPARCVTGSEGVVVSDDSDGGQRLFVSEPLAIDVTTRPFVYGRVDAVFDVAMSAFGLNRQGDLANRNGSAPSVEPTTVVQPSGSTVSPTVTPDCPDLDTLNKALADYGDEGTIIDKPVCSGVWAAAFPDADRDGHRYKYTVLFKFENGRWAEVDPTGPCADSEVPADIYGPACLSN